MEGGNENILKQIQSSNYLWMQSEVLKTIAKQLSGSAFLYAAKQKYDITFLPAFS